ncbi:hypothetical protein FAZ19_05790 [Sphingobacterium alkalisoli]|uniref:DUF4251 domain-containing protein n=1 Tax=Sphingobacterium alkalisoli TaxID=1874115 RepID=A0A4U0H421_9SPHI|nr:hypothetical protein [Sphingobacterium alkalisoli]TJY66433.1 hypothetical protein FAZ19_05790 [Sphingobacterium alkalisoli]GGH16438.1 hypothetical protein GCM10011418_18810 [Sphingobacterium alkalisoli]
MKLINRIKSGVGLFTLLTSLSACHSTFRQDSFEDKASFMEYVKDLDYGLKMVAEFPNGVKITPLFVPNDLILSEAKDKESFKGNLYLILSFSRNGKELLSQLPQGEYGAFVQTFSFGMDRFISAFIDDSKEAIKPIMTSFQPTYQMTNSNDLLVVFKRSEILNGRKLRLVINDFGLQTAEIKFNFDSKDIAYLSNVNILN